MKKEESVQLSSFLLRLSLFLVPVLLAWAFMEVGLSTIENSHSLKKRGMEAHLEKIECLVLGDSKALRGINPEWLDFYAFNLANVSQPLYYDVQLLEKYVDAMPSLRCVIFGVGYTSFQFVLTDSPAEWRQAFYAHYWSIYPENKKLGTLILSKIQLYGFRKSVEYAFRGFDVNLKMNISSYGWSRDPLRMRQTNGIGSAMGRVSYHSSLMRQKNEDLVIRALERLLEDKIPHSLLVVFVGMPLHSSYLQNCRSDILARNNAILKHVCDRYGCRHIDLTADPRFSGEDFTDSDHLNSAGARKLTAIINDMLKKELEGRRICRNQPIDNLYNDK